MELHTHTARFRHLGKTLLMIGVLQLSGCAYLDPVNLIIAMTTADDGPTDYEIAQRRQARLDTLREMDCYGLKRGLELEITRPSMANSEAKAARERASRRTAISEYREVIASRGGCMGNAQTASAAPQPAPHFAVSNTAYPTFAAPAAKLPDAWGQFDSGLK